MTNTPEPWEGAFESKYGPLMRYAETEYDLDADIKAFIRKVEQAAAKRTEERIASEVRTYRDHLRFVWRWIDRLHGGKEHDRPETNWRDYVACLTSYPSAPHQTGDWYEDDTSSPLLASLHQSEEPT
jgi:hypothetical protein